MVAKYIASGDLSYLGNAQGSSTSARISNALSMCVSAGSSSCTYNDTAPAQGGSYAVYGGTSRPGTSSYTGYALHYAALCA
jgi:hypothetical protein